jgi:hypothetical protein
VIATLATAGFTNHKLKYWAKGGNLTKYPDLVKNTPWKVTKRYFGCVIDDRSEFDRLVADPVGYKHVIFTGRENVPPMPAIQGSSLFHEVSTTGKIKMESTTRWVRPREASDEAPTRESIPEKLEGSASAILGAEMVTVKTLLKQMNQNLSSSKSGDDTRLDTGVPGESIVPECDSGVHHEDDLELRNMFLLTLECPGNT